MNVLGLFLLVVLIKYLINIARLISTKFYFNKFKSKSKNLIRYSAPVTHLFNKAGTQEIVVTYERMYGFKQLHKNNISQLLNDDDTWDKLFDVFNETIGVYSFRARQSFYPSYWLFLPTAIFNYFDYEPPRLLKLITTFVYWVIGFTVTYLLEIYLDQHFSQNLLQLMNNFLK